MKTVFKKILVGIMCGVMILSGTSCKFNPSAKDKEKYKEQRRKELDAIPIEDSRYTIEIMGDDEELPENMQRIYLFGWGIFSDLEVNGHIYGGELINCGYIGRDDNYSLVITRDNEERTIKLNYKEEFNKIGEVSTLIFYDNMIMLIRGGVTNPHHTGIFMDELLPYILFTYDYETDDLRYGGYFREWLNMPLYDKRIVSCQPNVKIAKQQ